MYVRTQLYMTPTSANHRIFSLTYLKNKPNFNTFQLNVHNIHYSASVLTTSHTIIWTQVQHASQRNTL